MAFISTKNTIRLIKDYDLEQMKEIWNQHHQFLTSTGRIHTTKSIIKWYENRHNDFHEYYGYFIDSVLKGFIIVRNPKNSLWIKMLAVELGFQSQGVGRALLDFVIQKNEKNQKYTECLIGNIIGLNFLITYGFKIIKFDSEYNEYTLKHE